MTESVADVTAVRGGVCQVRSCERRATQVASGPGGLWVFCGGHDSWLADSTLFEVEG